MVQFPIARQGIGMRLENEPRGNVAAGISSGDLRSRSREGFPHMHASKPPGQEAELS